MKQQQLKILFLPKWYPSKFDHYDGNFIENHAKAVHSLCTISVIFAHSDALKEKLYHLEKTAPHGFPEYRSFYKRSSFSFMGFLRYFKAQQFAYRQYLKDTGSPPDLVHVHINGRSTLLALYLKFRRKIPFIISEHWSGYTKESGAFKGWFRKLFYRFAASRASHQTAVSEYLSKNIQRHGIKGKFSVVPNVVNTHIFKPEVRTETIQKNILHISNLSSFPKNMPIIIEALGKVAEQRNDFNFTLIGTGPEEKTMLKLLDQSALKGRYRFLGEVPPTTIAAELRQADFLLLYSSFETQSCVMIEAFASGTPVLSSAVGGIPEYMNEERGILLTPNKSEVLEKGIVKMLDQCNAFSPELLSNYAETHFSEAIIAEKFMNLYRQSLSNAN